MKAHTSETQATITPAKALEVLKEADISFSNNLRVNRNPLQQAHETCDGQWPFAAVVSCESPESHGAPAVQTVAV